MGHPSYSKTSNALKLNEELFLDGKTEKDDFIKRKQELEKEQDNIKQKANSQIPKSKTTEQKSFDLNLNINIDLVPEDEIEARYKEFLNDFKHLFSSKENSNLLSNFIKNPNREKLRILVKKEIPKRQTLNFILVTFFKKYGIQTLKRSRKLENQSFEEKEKYLQNLQKLENTFTSIQKSHKENNIPNLYSKDRISKEITKSILYESPEEVENKAKKLAEIGTKERANFYQLKATIKIQGTEIPQMSAKSLEFYLDYYKTTELQERDHLVEKWSVLTKHEEKLAKELAKILKKNPDRLKEILRKFSELDFLKKEDFLQKEKKEEEKRLAKEKTTKQSLTQLLNSHSKELPTKTNKLLSKKVKEAKTKDELKKLFDEINQSIELNKKLNQEFEQASNQSKKDRKLKTRFLESSPEEKFQIIETLKEKIEASINEKEKNEKQEKQDYNKCYEESLKLASQKNFGQALEEISKFIQTHGVNSKIVKLQETIISLQKIHIEEQKEDDEKRKTKSLNEKEINELIEAKLKSKTEELERENLLYKQILAQKFSEQRSHGKIDSQERSLDALSSENKKTMKELFKQNKNISLHNNKKTEITNVDISKNISSQKEKNTLRKISETNSLKLKREEGIDSIQLKNSEGKNISAKKAKELQEKRIKESSKRLSLDIAKDNNTDNVIDLNKIMEKRMKDKAQKFAA